MPLDNWSQVGRKPCIHYSDRDTIFKSYTVNCYTVANCIRRKKKPLVSLASIPPFLKSHNHPAPTMIKDFKKKKKPSSSGRIWIPHRRSQRSCMLDDVKHELCLPVILRWEQVALEKRWFITTNLYSGFSFWSDSPCKGSWEEVSLPWNDREQNLNYIAP